VALKDDVAKLQACCADSISKLAAQRDEYLHARSCATAATAQGMAKAVMLNIKLQGLQQECESAKAMKKEQEAALSAAQHNLVQVQKTLEEQRTVECVALIVLMDDCYLFMSLLSCSTEHTSFSSEDMKPPVSESNAPAL
jgi:hypothetical protein